MNKIYSFCVSLSFLFFSNSYAQENLFKAELSISRFCKKISLEYFWKSYHPGEKYREKVQRGTINENNNGTGFECYSEKEGDAIFVHIGTLTNSQRGNATITSLGYQKQIIDYAGISINGRIEGAYLRYGVPRYSDSAKGFIPLPSLELSYTPRKNVGTFGIRQYFLPVDKITLMSLYWNRNF